MKTKILAGLILVFFLTAAGFASLKTTIIYETRPLSVDPNAPARWQYSYELANISLTPPIEEFTIYFEFGAYENLAVETPATPAGWDQIVWQPESVLLDDGAYDAKAMGVGIDIGHTVGGYAVSFDWLGVGEPGTQPYDIIDPQTFETIDSGQTIPEPATLVLLSLGAMLLRRKKLAAKTDDSKASGNQGTR